MAQKINVELLAKVREKILETPEAYDQGVWGREAGTPCGTAACIFGWAAHLSGKRTLDYIQRYGEDFDGFTIYEDARDALGLSEAEASTVTIGNGSSWPKPYRTRFQNAKTAKGRARAAAAYISHIIETGRVAD